MMHMTRNLNIQNGLGTQSDQPNGNSHVVVDVNATANSRHGHVHSSHCGHNEKIINSPVPLGLGLGLGRNSTRSVAAS